VALPRTDTAASHASLGEAYAQSLEINRQHGRSYFLATRLLPAHKRPHVHALYGFTRSADDIVDAPGKPGHPTPPTQAERRARLESWSAAFLAGVAGAPVTDPILPAVLNTIRVYALDLGDFDRFLRSMASDLTVTSYRTYDDLLAYMEGSAAVIGTMMLPILGVVPGGDPRVARESARQLGLAFQLTNMIRDVREDLDRGRIYLPEEDLDRFGVTGDLLRADSRHGRASAPVRALIGYECRRALDHYRAAKPGLALLEPRSRVCIRAAFLLYGGILDAVGRAGYDVLRGRVRVPWHRRAAIVATASSERLFETRTRRWRVG
jgi:phytoene synthase